MFSGIIKNTVRAVSVRKEKAGMRFVFSVPEGWNLEEGESINVDGICSTVESVRNKKFQVYYMPETLKRTSLGFLSSEHIFNLERCLTLMDLIGGHLVYGHVDTTATVSSVKKIKESTEIIFKIPKGVSKYMVYKGSIAVNGVSLTIVSVGNSSFSVSLIPYTLLHTNLGEMVSGLQVNIEVDMMAKHIEKLFNTR